MKKIINKYKNIIIIILFFGVCWTINFYNEIAVSNSSKTVILEIETDFESFKDISAFRISPTNYISSLIKDSSYNAFYSYRGEYLKSIRITVSNNKIVEKVRNLHVRIGNNKYSFTTSKFLNEWKKEEKGSNVSFSSPSYVRSSKSLFPYLNKIINWPGDIFLVFKTFLSTIVIFSFVGLIFALLRVNSGKDIYNIYYWSIFIFIIIFSLVQRMILNPLPYTGGDGWGFIGPAVRYFDTGEFAHISGRSFPYPFFVLAVLSFFNDFSYLSIIQHLIGILTAVILLLIWRDVTKNINNYSDNNYLYDSIGLILLFLYLFSESPIILEHHLRPESIYPIFLILQIFFVYKFICNIFLRKNRNVLMYGILFFCNNYFLFVFQPRWGFTLFFNLALFILLFILFKMNILKKTFFLILIPLAVSFVLIWLPENFLMKNKELGASFLPGNLFWAHSKIIDIELEKDINDKDFTRYDKEVLEKIRGYLETAFSQKLTKHKYLGFYFNRLYYGEPNRFLESKFSLAEYKKFCYYYFKKAVLNHPLKYIKKVALEMSQFYNLTGGMYTHRKYKVDSENYFDGYDRLSDDKVDYYPYRAFINALTHYKDSYYDFKEISFPGIEIIYFLLSKTYILVFLSFFVLFAKNLIFSLKKQSYSFNFIFGIFIFILFMYNFFITLTSSMTYCMDVGRYVDDQFLIVLFSNIFAILYLILNTPFFKKIKF